MRTDIRDREGSPDDFAYSGTNLEDDVIAELAALSRQDRAALIETFSTREIRTGPFLWTSVGLKAEGEIHRGDWEATGQILRRLDVSLQWLIGDWIVAGEKLGYGDHQSFAETIGFEVKTVYDFSYVARNVQFSVRTENLSFTHHKLVAPLNPDEQVYWLQRASAEGLSVARLREMIDGEQSLPVLPESNLYADIENRKRMNRVWRLVERSDWNHLRRDDLDALETWIRELKKKAKK
jgi:hypothetical protein